MSFFNFSFQQAENVTGNLLQANLRDLHKAYQNSSKQKITYSW